MNSAVNYVFILSMIALAAGIFIRIVSNEDIKHERAKK